MIGNEGKFVSKITFSSEVDEYGQTKKVATSSTEIEMYVKVFSQTNNDNPKYVDVELMGLTKSAIDTSNMVEIDGIKYDVLYVTPTKRYNEVFLRKTYQ